EAVDRAQRAAQGRHRGGRPGEGVEGSDRQARRYRRQVAQPQGAGELRHPGPEGRGETVLAADLAVRGDQGRRRGADAGLEGGLRRAARRAGQPGDEVEDSVRGGPGEAQRAGEEAGAARRDRAEEGWESLIAKKGFSSLYGRSMC